MHDLRVTPVEGVEVVYQWRAWQLTCTWPTRTRSDIQTLIKVEYLGRSEPELVKSTSRLNLISTSGIGNVAKAMARVGADRDEIPKLLEHVAEDLIGWYRRGFATTFPEPKPRQDGGWLIYPIWPRAGVTAVAAAGGSYKSFFAQALALQLATGDEVLRGNTRRPEKKVRVLFLDWEADDETFGERLHALQLGHQLPVQAVLAYRAMRTPLVDVAASLADEIGRSGYGAVIIDSMSAAAGGDLVESSTVNAFFDAARLLGVPCLVLAHKSAENVRKREARFFGSVMSENRVRLAWNAEKAVDGRTVLWEVFKDNNMGRWGDRLAWRIDFQHNGDHEHRRLHTVTLQGVNPNDVRVAADEGDKTVDRISYVLAGAASGLMPGEIATLAEIPDSTVRGTLKRGLERGMFRKLADGRYELNNGPDPF